jgi:thiamine-monophosphate kinase
MYAGIRAACDPAGVAVVGGDTSASRTDLFLAVMVLGDAAPRDALRRSGACVGDRLYVTGTLGDAKAGLELLQTRKRTNSYLITRHLTPTARLKEARHLADGRLASAAIDVSDGLAGDIRHICEESRVGCLIDTRKLPLSPQLLTHARARKRDPITYALSGGEDYELLFTVPPAKVARVDSLIRQRLLRATPIGLMTSRRQGLRVIGADGAVRPLTAKGYEHRI